MRYLYSLSIIASRNPSFSHPTFRPLYSPLGFLEPKSLHISTTYRVLDLFKKPEFITIRPWNRSSLARESASTHQEAPNSKPMIPTERVSNIVDEISDLTLLEVSDLTEILRKKFDVNEMPIMTVMMPGMGMGIGGRKGGGGAPKGEEKKAEKTAFDLKLESFDTASKIKIIKEVRTFTDLGLKEAKDLVEKSPTLLKKGVLKEEAEKIIAKMKEVGAKVVME